MLRRLGTFIRRELIAEVPADMDLCLDCGKLECSEGEFQACVRRKTRAAELTAALATPQSAADRRARKGAARKAIAAKRRTQKAVAKRKAPAKRRVEGKNATP
jgi:hypothetical protein